MTKDNKINPQVVYQPDDMILQFTDNNVLTTWKDINLKYSKLGDPNGYPEPWAGGVFDKRIFGSLFSGRCNCGRVSTKGLRCSRCDSTPLDDITAFKRFARIELPVYYCNDLRYPNLLTFLVNNFSFKLNIKSNLLGPNNRLTTTILEICQFDYLSDSDSILVTDNIDNYLKCSFEGLLMIISEHYPNKLNEFLKYINKNLLVSPIVMRAPYYVVINGERKLKLHIVSVIYQNILYAVKGFYDDVVFDLKSQLEVNLLRANLRRFISTSVKDLTKLLNTSKQNIARSIQSNRLSNSGRCVIVPAPNLRVDQVEIPRHLMYEACRVEFIQFIQDKLNVGEIEAEDKYKNESNTSAIQSLFDEYVDGDGKLNKGKYVIINRNPTLYELNMMSCKVILTNEYTMGIPNLLCQPFNGDFDGDQMSFYVIPNEKTDFINEYMSPKNIIYYKKNLKPLFLPTHEMMQGLILGTLVNIPEQIKEFNSLEEIAEHKKLTRFFRYQTLVLLNGNKTTLARELFSAYFGTDLNEYLDGLNSSLNSKNIIPLYVKLSDLNDRVDRIKNIQKLSLLIVTLSGATAPSLSELYVGIDNDILSKIKTVDDDKNLSYKEKDLKIREIYTKYSDKVLDELENTPVKLKLQHSSRGKLSQLLSIVMPELHVGPDKKYTISTTALIQGQNPNDYTNLAIENRATQDIKQASVPLSGSINRQFEYLAESYIYSEGKDTGNQGIEIPMDKAVGRTLLDGRIIKNNNSNKLVKVRSIVTSTKPDEVVITSDMITNSIKYKEGSHIGISMITSFTEGLTQGGLALKHGGNLFDIDPLGYLHAKEPCEVIISDLWIRIKTKSSEKLLPKPDNFILSYPNNNTYKVGDIIGVAYQLNTQSFKLDSVIAFTGAKSYNMGKKYSRNSINISDCYALSSGIIHYEVRGDKISSVKIGRISYEYNPNSLYFYPEGAMVKSRSRFCTGVLNFHNVLIKVQDKLEAFYLFREQFTELLPGIGSEITEFLFTLLVRKKNNKLIMKNVINLIQESDSVYNNLSFGWAKKTLSKIKPEGSNLGTDVNTYVTLSLLFNNLI